MNQIIVDHVWILSNHLNLPVIRLDFHERIARFNHLYPIIHQDLLRAPCPLDPLFDNALKPTRPSTRLPQLY